MSEFMQKIDEALKVEIAARHSYFQLKYFVIGKEPTTQAQMWQCLRELKARRDSLAALELEIADTQDKLELQILRIERTKCDPQFTQYCRADPVLGLKLDAMDKQEQAIKMRQMERQKTALELSLTQIQEKKTWVEQEANFFLETYRALEKMEPLKHFDDLESQQSYWNEKLSQEINMKMLLQSPLDTELVKTVLALHDDAPIKRQLITMLTNIQTQLVEMKQKKVINKEK